MSNSSSPPADRRELVQRLFIEQVVGLRRFVTSLTPDVRMAEDVLQETFVELTKRAASYDRNTSFAAWMNEGARGSFSQLGWQANASGRALREEVLGASRPETHAASGRLRFIDDCIQLLAPQAPAVHVSHRTVLDGGAVPRELPPHQSPERKRPENASRGSWGGPRLPGVRRGLGRGPSDSADGFPRHA